MILPPDQLKVRLEAAFATLKRLDDVANLDDETYHAICRARFRLMLSIAALEDPQRAR